MCVRRHALLKSRRRYLWPIRFSLTLYFVVVPTFVTYIIICGPYFCDCSGQNLYNKSIVTLRFCFMAPMGVTWLICVALSRENRLPGIFSSFRLRNIHLSNVYDRPCTIHWSNTSLDYINVTGRYYNTSFRWELVREVTTVLGTGRPQTSALISQLVLTFDYRWLFSSLTSWIIGFRLGIVYLNLPRYRN